MKYGIWNIARPQESEIQGLERAGFSPLTARVLCGRGCVSPEDAKKQLDASAPLCDPLAMKELGAAAALLQKAVADGTKIAVFGDYDVDGITATCLLVECLLPCVFFGIVKRGIFSIVLEFRKRFPRPSFDTYFTMPQCSSDDFRTAPRK